MFKHKTDTVHYHDTAVQARECEFPPQCVHGSPLSQCNGPQHYYFDQDEQTFGGQVNTGAVPALSDQQAFNMGLHVKTHFQGSVRTPEGLYRLPVHESTCVCSPYDRCWEVRVADAQWSGNSMDKFRAHND